MESKNHEVEKEVFDPTGQGVEVVDAEFARRLACERDEARKMCDVLKQECSARDEFISLLKSDLLRSSGVRGVETLADQLGALSEFGLLAEFGKYAGCSLVGKLSSALVSARTSPCSPLYQPEPANPGLPARLTAIEEENRRLREIFPKVLEALGNSEVCGSGAAIVFLENIPEIVKEEVVRLKQIPSGDECKGTSGELEVQPSLLLSQIALVVSDYCRHEECTVLDAVKLMRCRVMELEAAEVRRQIQSSWNR